MAWAGFTQVFLTPVDMIKLKMMENCQLKTPFQTVCLITVGFCPMVLSWCGPVTPGMPKGFLTNPVQLFWQRYIIPELKWQLFFYCFIYFILWKWLHLLRNNRTSRWAKLNYTTVLNILGCTGWAPTFTAWMRWRTTSSSLTCFGWRSVI